MEYLEKRNIYISKELKTLICNDARLFEVFKKNPRVINLNRFISLLLVGYYDSYLEENDLKYKKILEIINQYKISDYEKTEIADMILRKLIVTQEAESKSNKTVAISLKPTKDTLRIIQSIENELAGHDTFSQYIRRMIISYFQKAMWERERIIFHENYNTIQAACTQRFSLVFSSIWDNKQIHEVMPYKIAKGSDGMFNYLVCAEANMKTGKHQVRSYRLCRMTNLGFGHNRFVIGSDIEMLCEKTVLMSPQYAINSIEESCVKLSDAGEKLYNRIFFGRPVYSRIDDRADGHYYYFNCSTDQIYHYFRRFDNSTAMIVYPEELKDKMISFHRNAYESYK